MDLVELACISLLLVRARRKRQQAESSEDESTSSSEEDGVSDAEQTQIVKLPSISIKTEPLEKKISLQPERPERLCQRKRGRHWVQPRLKRRYWVKPMESERTGIIRNTLNDLRADPENFFEFFRMPINSFDKLLSIIGHKITKKATVMRKPITAEERLGVTLRYLATGKSLSALHLEFHIGKSTVGGILRETCEAIWTCLLPLYMKPKTTEEWEQVSEQFYTNTQFPNCVGAVVAKQVPIVYSNNSELPQSSLVILGLVDGDFYFTAVDVSGYRDDDDFNIFRNSDLGQKVENNRMNFPPSKKLPNDENGKAIPFMIVGDGAFAQTQHVIRSYPQTKKHPERNFTEKKRVFNSRIECARRVAECTFGTMASKWQVLRKNMEVDIHLAKQVVQACCILHNYVQKENGFCPVDIESSYPWTSLPPHGVRGNWQGIEYRDYLADYFMSPRGSVPWQEDKNEINKPSV